MQGERTEKETVLIAERAEYFWPRLAALVRLLGLEPVRCHSSEQAQKVAQQAPPRLCLLDLLLSKPDGFDLCQALKERDPALPVIMISNLLTDPGFVKDDMERVGADGFLGRGFSEEQARKLLSRHLARSRRVHQEAAAVPWSGRRCLIVEEDTRALASHEELARSLGVEPLSAATAEQGLALFRTHRPDLCLVALDLPQGKGPWLLEQLRREARGVPPGLVLMSGAWRDIEQLRQEVARHQADDFLVCPFEQDALRDLFHVHLELAAPQQRRLSGLAHYQPDAGQHMAARLAKAGRLEVMDLSSLLFRLYLQRGTGSLELGEGESLRVVRFIQGRPVFVSGALDKTRTGEMMLKRGMLRTEPLQRLLRQVPDALALGERVLDGQLAREDEVEEIFEELVRNALLDCFTLQRGPWRFAAGSRALAGPRFVQNPALVIREAVVRHCSGNELAALMEPLARHYVRRSGVFAHMEPLFPLHSYQEEVLLSQIDGQRTVAELMQPQSMTVHLSLELLWSLYQARMILFTEQPEEMEEAPSHSSASFGTALRQEQDYASEPSLSSRPEPNRSLWSRMFER